MGYLALLWASRTIAGASLATTLWLTLTHTAPVPSEALAAPIPTANGSPRTTRIDSLVPQITRRNPFRVHRSAAVVRYGGSQEPDALPARPPRPSLALVGVVLGQDTAALIDGLPGTDGTRLLRLGERVGEYSLRSVDRDRAIIASADTTWTLTVRQPQ